MPSVMKHSTCARSFDAFDEELWDSQNDECSTQESGNPGALLTPGWQEMACAKISEYVREVLPTWLDIVRMESLEKEVVLLKNRCELLESTAPVQIPIQTLAPAPYEIIEPLIAVIRRKGDQYIASVFDANISASGDTETDAMFDLKDMLVSSLDMFEDMDDIELGPGPLRQKQVLQRLIRKKV